MKQSEKRFWSLGLHWTIYTYIYWFYWAKLLQETSNILLCSPFVKLSYPKRSTTNYNQRGNKDCKSACKYRFHKPKCQNSCVKIVSYAIQRWKVCYYRIVSLGVFERPLSLPAQSWISHGTKTTVRTHTEAVQLAFIKMICKFWWA